MTNIGHNTDFETKGHLKYLVEKIERLEEEKATTASDIRDLYSEAKGNGFDVKALRAVIRRRKQDAAALALHEALVQAYLEALGPLVDTPLGKAAMQRAFA